MGLLAILFMFLQSPTLLADRDVNEYTNQICRKPSPGADVTLFSDSDVRAEASRPGRISLSTGLFARTRNEAELAGAIAHAIAHAAAGTDCIRYVHSNVERMGEAEAMADKAAIRMLTKAGYNPSAMLDFFSKYRREGNGLNYSLRELLMEKLEIEDTDQPLKDAILDTPEFDRVHRLVQ
jgi:predicted Zn-dependent protease